MSQSSQRRPAAVALGLLLTIPLLVSSPDVTLFALQNGNGELKSAEGHVAGRVLVKFRDEVSPGVKLDLIAAMGAQTEGEIQGIGVLLLRLPPGLAEHAASQALAHLGEVEFAEVDAYVEPDRLPNDPYYPNQWHLSKIGGPAAWDSTVGSAGVIVAILDTGVDGTHPDLAGKMVPGWNMYNNNSDTRDVYGHGTAVAGTAAAAADNAVGVASIAWNSLIMPVRISDPSGYATYSTVASGFTWAADHGARVANLSYMMTTSSTVTNAAKYFQQKGGVVTMSAGNYSTFDPTSDNPYVLTVSATDGSDNLASWSNTGNNVDLSAPGVGVWTTSSGGGYGGRSGTSFSAPVVAGVAALVMAANPDLSATQVQDILKQSADDRGASGWDPSYGWGRVNAGSAVALALSTGGSPPPAPDTQDPKVSFTYPAPSQTVSGTVTVQVSASDNVGVASVSTNADGNSLGTDTGSPYNFTWSTLGYANGTHTLSTTAKDAAGNSSTATMTVMVNNVADTSAPAARITSPTNGATVSGTETVLADAGDDVGVVLIELYLDGSVVSRTSSSVLKYKWNTRKFKSGWHTLEAKAYDAAGNVGSSNIVTVKK